jgi:hypothetical protein
MKIEINGFGGLITKIAPHLLPNEAAQAGQGFDVASGSLRPALGLVSRTNAQVGDLSPSVTRFKKLKFRNADRWVSGSNGERWFVSPIIQDQFDRFYFTRNNGAPQMGWVTAGGVQTTNLGIAIPNGTLSITGGTTGEFNVTTRYLYVLVSQFGEISAPSTPSLPVSINPSSVNTTITLSEAPTSTHWTEWRLYRQDQNGTYRFLTGKLISSGLVINDTIPESGLQEELNQLAEGELNEPPPETMRGLTLLPNGVFAGFEDQNVYFSKPYLPHAWPSSYRIAIDGKIVGMETSASGLVVVTDRKPYLIAGSDPSAMAAIELDMVEPCSTPDSIVDMGAYVVYASPNGLIAVGTNAQNLTENIISRDDWLNRINGGVKAVAYQGKYWMVSNGGQILTFNPSNGAIEQFSTGESIHALFADSVNSTLYMATANGWRVLDGVTRSGSFQWVSKDFVIGERESLTSAKVMADSEVGVSVSYYNTNGTLITTHSQDTTGQAFRLPAVRAHKVRIGLSVDNQPNTQVHSVQLATTMQEII